MGGDVVLLVRDGSVIAVNPPITPEDPDAEITTGALNPPITEQAQPEVIDRVDEPVGEEEAAERSKRMKASRTLFRMQMISNSPTKHILLTGVDSGGVVLESETLIQFALNLASKVNRPKATPLIH